MYKKFIIIIVSILLILNNININETFTNKCKDLNIIHFNMTNTPKIVIIGGVHGNEYGPVYGIEKFIENNFIKNKNIKEGNIIFIPKVNDEGFEKSRYYTCLDNKYDINRHFNKENKNKNIQKILETIQNSDFVIDFHEGFDFHKINNTSIGSTIKYLNTPKSEKICNHLINNINKTIIEINKKFTPIKEKDRYIKNSLSDYCNLNNIDYNLIEITGQNNKQHLDIRIKQTIIILNSLFKYFKLSYKYN